MQNILHPTVERQELKCLKGYIISVSFPLTRVEHRLCLCGWTHKAKQGRPPSTTWWGLARLLNQSANWLSGITQLTRMTGQVDPSSSQRWANPDHYSPGKVRKRKAFDSIICPLQIQSASYLPHMLATLGNLLGHASSMAYWYSKGLQTPLCYAHRSRKICPQKYFYFPQRNSATRKLVGKSHRVHRDSEILL